MEELIVYVLTNAEIGKGGGEMQICDCTTKAEIHSLVKGILRASPGQLFGVLVARGEEDITSQYFPSAAQPLPSPLPTVGVLHINRFTVNQQLV